MSKLKLSDAIVLGDTLKAMKPNVWLTEDGSCGCAFGGALLAAGVSAEILWAEMGTGTFADTAEMASVRRLWPWLGAEHLFTISELYWAVYRGEKTIEDVAAYVRSVEPTETAIPSPVTADEMQEVGVV